MSQDLKLALTIGLNDRLMGPLQRALGEVNQGLERIAGATAKVGAQSQQASTKLGQLGTSADSIGTAGLMRLKGSVSGIGNAADFSKAKVTDLSTAMEKLQKIAVETSTAMLGVVAAQRIISVPVKAFASLEDANSELKVTMMKKGSRISGNYESIQKQAVALGNALPGSTKDFVGSANQLLSLGASEEAVINGGLTSAAHLGVVLKLPQLQAAETVAKMREAYSLKDSELPGMADEIQRNRFAFGINPSDLLLAAKYSAPTLNTLGLSGKENMSEVLTLQGMANMKGMDGSQFGTNFGMMLTRLAKGPLMLEESKSGMKAEVSKLMDDAGIKFNFFDSAGSLKKEDGSAVKGMLRELEKLETIRKRFGDKTALEVAESVFGQEAARPAQILAQYGVQGFEEARTRVGDQASLEERTAQSLTTLNSKIEATTGSFENLMASMGKTIGEGSKSPVEDVNDWLGSARDFADRNPGISTSAVLGAAGVAGWGIWKSGAAIWNAMKGRGAEGIRSVSNNVPKLTFPALDGGAVQGGANLLGKTLSAGSAALGPLMLLESLTQPSDSDIASLRYQDLISRTEGLGHRGKGFNDPRSFDSSTPVNASTSEMAMMSEAITRLEAIANRPVIVTLDGQVIANSVNQVNTRMMSRQ